MAYTAIDIVDIEQISITNHLPDLGIDNIRKEVIDGLMANPKYISSKFFYDDKGSKLFQAITKLPEYYPTRTEKGILEEMVPKLMKDFKNRSIVELGSGDHSKISILLKAIRPENIKSIKYIPVDISQSAIKSASENLIKSFPDLTVDGLVLDFINQLELIPSDEQRLFCFLGSTLGNFNEKEANSFLKDLSSAMNSGDSFLLGLDMVKPIPILHDAYNDDQKITAEFNKNILNVVNEIIDSEIDPDNFEHKAFFNATESRIEMHLKANKKMLINFPYSNTSISINRGEYIHTENSYKFSKDRITVLEQITNLKIQQIFTDEKNWFSIVLFEK